MMVTGLRLTACIMLIVFFSGSVFANTVTYYADISENFGGPRSSGYHLQEFSVSANGSYDMQVVGHSGYMDSFFYLYSGSYAAGVLLSANDDSVSLYSRIIASLSSGTTYTLLTSTFGSGYTSTVYTNQISGPGEISLAGAIINDLTVSLLQSPFNSPYDLAGGSETYENVTLLDGLIQDSVSGGLLTASTGFTVYEGTISANLAGGSLTKFGAGTVYLTGTNSYSGGTTVSAGTLTGDSTSLQGDIVNAAAVVFDQATDGSYADIMSGTGTLSKENTGALTLSGDNTYTGTTTVNNGALLVNGSLTSDVTVMANGLFGGAGSTTGAVTNFGSIAPGDIVGPSFGTLTVGSYTSEPGSTLEIDVNGAGTGDLVAATGTATLNGGNVDVFAGGVIEDYARRTSYNIVTADNVTGTFDGVSINMAALTPVLVYDDPSLVELLLVRQVDIATLAAARTKNQRAVSGVLTEASQAAFSGELADLLDLFVVGMSAEEQQAALDEIGGQKIHTAIPMVSFGQIEAFQGAVGNRMGNLHRANQGALAKRDPLDGVMLAMAGDVTDLGPLDEKGQTDRNLWAHLYGVNGNVDGDQNAVGYDYDIYGAAFGVDFPVAKGINLGFTAGISTADIDTDIHDSAETKGYLAGIYGNYEKGAFYTDAQVTYAYNDYETTRRITVGPITERATGDYNGDEWSVAAELGYAAKAGKVNVQPFIGSRWIRLNDESFTEKGAGDLSLDIDGRTTESWTIFPGLRANLPITTKSNILFVPELSVKLIREMGDDNDVVEATLTGAPAAGSFRVEGVETSRTSVELGASLRVYATEKLEVYVDLASAFNGGSTSNSLTGGMKLFW